MLLTLNKDDLKGGFKDSKNCPLYRALERQGYDVKAAGALVVCIGGEDFEIIKPLSTMSKILKAQRDKTESITVEIDY